MAGMQYVVAFEQLRNTDVGSVGGKNASLGEMISQLANSGVRVPGGFATTADAYRDFLAHEGLLAQQWMTMQGGAVVMVGPARPPGESNVNVAVARQTNQAFEAPAGGEV